MPNSRDPTPFPQEHATLWPHAPIERLLPDEVEHYLCQAAEYLLYDRPRAVTLAEQAVTAARCSPEEDNVLARTLYRAAGTVQQAQRPDRAYVLCLEAQALLERRDDRWRATRILLLRGQCCLDVGEHARALALADEAAERFRRMEDRTELARSLSLGALSLGLAGELDAAVQRAEQAVTLLDPARHPPLDISFRNNEASLRLQRGELLAQRGDTPAAEAEHARASALLPDASDVGPAQHQPDGGKVIETIVRAALATGDRATLALALRKLSTWAPRRSGGPERGLAWLALAEVQLRRGRRGPAACSVRSALRHLARHPQHPRLVTAHQLLAQLREADGDAQGAWEACSEALRIEAEQQREAIAVRADLLALDLDAEQELRKTEQTLAYAQRLSNVGQLVAGVNHELNQPMASIRMHAETAIELIERGERDEITDTLRSMLKLSTRLTDLTSQFAAFPAPSAVKTQQIQLRTAVEEALASLRSRLTQTRCDIEIAMCDILVHGQESQLTRVITNLVNNALDALEATPDRRIMFSCVHGPAEVVLSVADNGPGLTPTVLERLFQPFFSTKAVGRGLGLGLVLSRDVMREMGGDLGAHNAPGGGAVFEVKLRPAL